MPKPIALIIPISEHNIAQLYNCLAVTVDAIVLLASRHFDKQRERFQKVLNELKPETTIIDFSLPDDAENYALLHRFARNSLLSLSEQYRLELNGTGGTKVIPLVLIDSLPIHKVYYKGQRHQQLQSWQPGHPESHDTVDLTCSVSAEKALALYVSGTKPASRKPTQFEDEPAIAVANSIWQQYHDPASPMSWLAAELAQSAWTNNSKSQASFPLAIPDKQQNNPAWQQWFEKLSLFSKGQLIYNQTHLIVQNSTRKKASAYQFKRWLSGDWLEQLVKSWLNEKLPEDQLLSGVRPSATGEQGDSRELDFICFHNTSGYVIETKVTTEPGQEANKMVQQVVSLADNFGKLRKVLLLSPLFFQQKHDEHALSQFEQYCKGHNVTLCRSKADLLRLFS